MNDLDDFLHELSDNELAIFFWYRYEGFLAKSKMKIDSELEKRKLSRENLQSLLNTKLDKASSIDGETCPRCGSDKLFVRNG